MASPAAVLSILVEANTKAANASLAKTDAQLRGTAAAATATSGATSKTGTALRKMGTAAKWAGLAVGAAFVIEAKKAVTTTQDLTKSTISLHKNLGLSNKQASEWAGVAKARGVDTTKLGMAFKTLSTQIVAARDGSATSILMFKRLGLSQQEIQRASVDTSFAVKAVADGLNNLKGGADKTAIAGKLFGRGWQTIAPVLRDGSKAMQDQLDLVQKYGGVLEGKTLKQQEELLANIRENKIAWQGFQVELAKFVTPVLNDVSKQFQRIAAINADPKLTDAEKWRKIARIIDKDFRKALDVIVQLIPEVASRVGQAAPKIAEALVKGFLNANVWGKLLIGGFLIKKLGGWAAITALGTKFGTRFGGGIAAGTAATAGEGAAVGGGAAAAGGATPWGAIILGAAAAGVGVHELMKAFGNYLKQKDQVERANEIIGGQYGHLGKVGKQLAAQVKSTGEVIQNQWDSDKIHIHGAATAEVQLIEGLHKHYGSFAIAGRNLSKTQRNAWIDMAQSARDNGDITQKQLMRLTNAFTNVGQKNRKMWRDASKATGESVKSIRRSVGDMTIKVGKDVAGPKGMVEVVGGGIDLLAQNLNQSLGSLGVAKAKFMVSPTAHPGHGQAGTRNFQRGGLIPGRGDGDKVPVMAEPGEGFINKRAVRSLGGKQAIEAINKQFPRFAAGGFVGMKPGITKLVKNVISRFGGYLSSGYRPGDVGSFHSKGLAADWVGGDWMGASRYINSIGPSLLEGIHQAPPGRNVSWDSGHKVSPSFWGAATWNEHTSHIHMAIAGAVKAAVDRVARVILKGPPGALTDMGQASLDKVHKAANAYLAKQRPALGNEMLGAGVKTGPIQKMARQMVSKIWGAGQWGPFSALEMSEAGWNPRALNPSSGAAGLAQALPASKYPPGAWPYKGLGSAKLQLEWMMGYIRDRYGTPSKAWAFHQANNYYKQGGVVAPYVGSFDKGGQVASTGLGLLHQGESVVPNLQHGGTVHRLHHQAHQLQHRIRSAEQRIEHQRASEHPDKALIHHLNKLMHELEIHRETVKELISENKELRKESKADRRERHEIAVNETPVFRALRNFVGREIGYQYVQSRRNVSPGRAVRY